MNLRSVLRNVSSQWLMLGAQIVISLLMAPFLLSRLGEEGYGVLSLISDLVGYSGVLYFGLGAAIVKFVAEHHAQDDQDAVNETVSTIFSVYLAVGVACLLVAAALAVPLPSLFKISPGYANEARAMLLMMGVALAAQFPGSVYGGVIMGLQRYDIMNTYLFALLLARSAAVVALVLRYPSAAAVTAVSLGSFVFEQLLAMYYARKLMPGLRVSLRLYRRSRLGVLFSFSAQSFLFTLSEKLINYTDGLVIAQARGAKLLAIYAFPIRLTDYSRDAVDRATHVLLPGVSAAAARGEIDRLKSLWRVANKAVLCLALPIALVLLYWGDDVLRLWLGGDQNPKNAITALRGYECLVWLALAFVMQVMGRGIARPLLEGLGKLAVPARITVAEGLANFVLSVVLVRSWGLPGVAFATFVPAAVTGLFVMPWYVCRLLHRSYLGHVYNTLGRALPPLAPAWAVLWLAERAGLHRHLVTQGLTCAVVLIVYVAGALLVTFDADEREAVLGRFRRGRPEPVAENTPAAKGQ